MIPYARPKILKQDIINVNKVLKSQYLTTGPEILRFEKKLSSLCKSKYAMTCNSATSALHLCCLALGLSKNDYVWTSSITFVASANCALYCGAKIQLIDIDPDTLNISIEKLEKKLIFKTWQGVQHRVDNPFRFFHAFSVCKGFHNKKLFNLLNHAVRPLTSIYFFTLLNIVKIKIKKFTYDEKFLEQYIYWNDKLVTQDTNYFGGDSLNIIDYQLFGVIQCHCSIPHSPLIKTLQENTDLGHLRKWISNMHIKFANYPHLYSASFFNPKQKIIHKASFLEQTIYWSGLITFLLILPLTLFLILILIMRRK